MLFVHFAVEKKHLPVPRYLGEARTPVTRFACFLAVFLACYLALFNVAFVNLIFVKFDQKRRQETNNAKFNTGPGSI